MSFTRKVVKLGREFQKQPNQFSEIDIIGEENIDAVKVGNKAHYLLKYGTAEHCHWD